MKKYLLILIVILIVGGGVYWYGSYAGWFFSGPNNLPTQEEWKRIREVERSSGQIDPNAKAGVGVAAPGTLPPPPPIEEATSTATTTEDTVTTSEESTEESLEITPEAEENV